MSESLLLLTILDEQITCDAQIFAKKVIAIFAGGILFKHKKFLVWDREMRDMW